MEGVPLGKVNDNRAKERKREHSSSEQPQLNFSRYAPDQDADWSSASRTNALVPDPPIHVVAL